MDANAKLDATLGRKASIALDHAVLHFDGAATASTTLRNSTIAPSPVRFTTRPLWTAIIGSIRSLRSARSRANIRSSSEPASLLYPTTSDTKIAASFRVSATAPSARYHSSIECRSLLGLDSPTRASSALGQPNAGPLKFAHAEWAGIVAVRSVAAMSQLSENHPDKLRGRWLRKRG